MTPPIHDREQAAKIVRDFLKNRGGRSDADFADQLVEMLGIGQPDPDYVAYCIECGERNQRVEQRLGAWMCPVHHDRGHVRFERLPDPEVRLEIEGEVAPCVRCQRPINAGIGTFWLALNVFWIQVTDESAGAWREGGRQRSRLFQRKGDAQSFELDVKRRQALGPLAPTVMDAGVREREGHDPYLA